MNVHITHHAIARYLERVDPRASDEQIRAALTTPAVRLAAEQGCQCAVKLPGGQRIVVQDHTIVTVLPREKRKRCKIGRAGE